MAVYAIYSYEIQEGDRSLFYKETGVKAIDMANEIIGNLLNDGLTVVGKKRKQDQPLKSLHFIGREGVFTWELCDVEYLAQYEGHEKNTLESYPGGHVIIDNRPNVCQIAIEKTSAFNSDTEKVAKYLGRALNKRLLDYGLKIVIKRKFQAGKFKELIRERIIKHHDSVKKVVWEFPNPAKVKGIDTSQQMKNWLEGLQLFTQATNVLKGQLTLFGSKGCPLNMDDEKIEDVAQIFALSAQNNYKLYYYFFNSPVIKSNDVGYAYCSIDNSVILSFKNGQFINGSEGITFELIDKLDEVRMQIADYDYEKIIDERE